LGDFVTGTNATDPFDALVFGQRLRHLRRAAGLTLDQLGERVGKPAPYLSLVENGKREPRVSLISALASALGVAAAELLSHEPPNERARLEIELQRVQDDPAYRNLGLPKLRATTKLPDLAIEHILTLHDRLIEVSRPSGTVESARAANVTLRRELEASNNYLAQIEHVAREALDVVGYPGQGAVPQAMLTALAKHVGFTVHQDADVPSALQSVADFERKRIYIPQRDALRTREARVVILRTLGHFVLGHEDPADYESFLRQRIHANYFARAVLMPEGATATLLAEAHRRRDLAVEDLKEMFYVGYAMAAHRFANLITHHLGVNIHYVRTDREGVIWRGWATNGIPLPEDEMGVVIGKRLCRHWGGRAVFDSDQRYGLLHQFLDTPVGTYFETSHVLVDDPRQHAVTVGTDFEGSRYFRGRDSEIRATSTCPDPTCCRQPSPELTARWRGNVWASLHEPPAVVSVSATAGLDTVALYEFLEGRPSG
jgi:transcriptional regulator with XRE-family HTH domain/predicted transcriptional regulator